MLEELKVFLASDREYMWHVDERVWLDGDWDEFLSVFANCDADLLATNVRTRRDDADWWHWRNFHEPVELGRLTDDDCITAYLWCMRLSRKAAEILVYEDGGLAYHSWHGHVESVLPTACHVAGLKIQDIGERWYDAETWKWQGAVHFKKGMLHHPVEHRQKKLSPYRFRREVQASYRILFSSPVGKNAVELLPRVLEQFSKAGADVFLMQYDDGEELHDIVRGEDVGEGKRQLYEDTVETPLLLSIKDRGYKWQLAMRHLHPDVVAKYDYIFLWDDDLAVGDFDAQRFVKIMAKNFLTMAQPSITSPHDIAHGITQCRELTSLLSDENGERYDVVGRMTNFVEVMAPVFSREGWREFYSYLVPENKSGYGYDYIPLARKGIIDVMPVVHTRAVQSYADESFQEMEEFFKLTGLKKYELTEIGDLYE